MHVFLYSNTYTGLDPFNFFKELIEWDPEPPLTLVRMDGTSFKGHNRHLLNASHRFYIISQTRLLARVYANPSNMTFVMLDIDVNKMAVRNVSNNKQVM